MDTRIVVDRGTAEAEIARVDTRIVVDEETADAEIARALEAAGVEMMEDRADGASEGRMDIDLHTRRLRRAIQRGRLAVDDEGRFVLQRDPPLTFRAPTGATLMTANGPGENVRKLFQTLAELTGTTAKTFSQMPLRDVQVCDSITALFFA